MSVFKTPIVSITVFLQENESIEQAYQRLNCKRHHLQASRWHKRRYGYYEKLSQLKNKKKRMRINQIRTVENAHYSQEPVVYLSLKIGLQAQFAREGKNAVGY